MPCGMQGNPAGCKYLTVRCSTSSRGCGACAVQLTVPVYQHALCVVVVQHSINGVRCTTCTLLHVRVSYHVGGHNTTLRSVPFRGLHMWVHVWIIRRDAVDEVVCCGVSYYYGNTISRVIGIINITSPFLRVLDTLQKGCFYGCMIWCIPDTPSLYKRGKWVYAKDHLGYTTCTLDPFGVCNEVDTCRDYP